MKRKQGIRLAVLAALTALSAASIQAFAVDEIEPNAGIPAAQHLTIGSDGTAEVHAVMGQESGTIVYDVDFYSFEGKEGDIVTIDIDDGMKPSGGGRSLDSFIALFSPGPEYDIVLQNDNVPSTAPLDDGSISRMDARIDNQRLPRTGTYIIGVSSAPRSFLPGGLMASTALRATSNGSYTLRISGVSPDALVMRINIDIKPGSTEYSPINPKSRGSIPVALLSSADFSPMEVDPTTLRFGQTGNEDSLVRCNKEGADLNHDGIPDRICHFSTQLAAFEPDAMGAIVRGKVAGKAFEGQGNLKVVPNDASPRQ